MLSVRRLRHADYGFTKPTVQLKEIKCSVRLTVDIIEQFDQPSVLAEWHLCHVLVSLLRTTRIGSIGECDFSHLLKYVGRVLKTVVFYEEPMLRDIVPFQVLIDRQRL
jgi:hypothetical protein